MRISQKINISYIKSIIFVYLHESRDFFFSRINKEIDKFFQYITKQNSKIALIYTNLCLNYVIDYQEEFAQNEDDAGKLTLVIEENDVLNKFCRQDVLRLNRD